MLNNCQRLACGTVKNIVKVQVCNLRLINWQYWTNRPQWCRHWVVFGWTPGPTLWL